MSRKNISVEKPSNNRTTPLASTDVKQQDNRLKQFLGKNNRNNVGPVHKSDSNVTKSSSDDRAKNKDVLPPIPSARSRSDDKYNNTDNNEQDFEVIDEDFLPLKLFDGKKQSLSEISEESMSYLWVRRIKEIFLHMGDGKDEQDDDPFVEFDMNLAKTDMANTCDRYIENERLALTKKDTSATTATKTTQHIGFLQAIQDHIKELNNLINNSSSADLPSLLSKCIGSLQELDKHTQEIIDKLRKQQTSSSELDVRIIHELIRSLQMTIEKKEKSDLDKKQEWDMKKLYAEVFKMSYKRNRLQTKAEQDELKPIKKGDDQPNFGNAIWWYSCDKANIYYQINSILRLENFELLMSYRYYLSDLCRMIEFMYQQRKDEKGDIEQTFYRAGHINKKQLENMGKQQKNQFISLLGFISATTDIEIAKGYARKQNVSKDNERVLFQIKIKPQEPCTAFAYIEGISFHPEEKEVLFSMGSVFTVDDIAKPKTGENFHTVKLTASEIDKTLIDDIRTKVEDCSPSGRAVLLAQYLMELGEYRATRKYLNCLLIQSCDGGILINDPNLATIYHCLGTTYARQGLHGDALKAFKQALNAQARLEYSNNNALANIHNNIGSAYVGLDYMNEAEETLTEALRIQLREVNSNQQNLASIYSNMGYVHYKKANYDKAQDAFSEAGKIYKQSSSKIAHDALEQSLMKAEYFINYGNFLSNRKSLTEAQKQYSEALKLYKSILPDNDPKLMQTYINIMLAYAQNKKYDEVTKLFEDLTVTKLIDRQEINMFELNSSVTLGSLALLHEFVGVCYAKQESFDKAIGLWTRTLVFKRKTRLEQLLLQTTNSYSSTLIAEKKTLLSEGYDEAREYYESSKNKMCESNEGTNPDFCLGLLYAESYSFVKAIKCLTKATPSLTQSNSDKLYAVYLLLGDMYKQQHEYKKAVESFDQALPLIKSLKNQKDRVLEIEVELARSDCLVRDDQSRNAIDDLQKLAKSLKLNDTDTKRISLKVIVYDILARYCLIKKKYELFDKIAEESMLLKLRSFSQYHPSLAINLILIAERHSQEFHYHDALYFYEQALEVQCLNLTNNHPKIKKICYAIGDIYCKIDKLSNAMEKYDVAENKNSSTDDDDDVIQQDKLNSEESIEILMARISMYRHLAEFHAKKQVYKEAITQMNKIIDLLKEELPSSIFEISDETILIKKSFDQATVLSNLRQLASCYMHLGDILGFEQEDQKGYKEALIIYKKLFQYEKESARANLVLINQKLSNYYEKCGEIEDALDYLQETIELEEPTIAILYRLGHLNFFCDNLDEAKKNYEKILLKQSTDEQTTLRQIIQEKLVGVQKEVKKSHRRWSTSSSESGESRHNSAVSNSSNKLGRNATNASITSGKRSELNRDINADNKVDSSDYRAMAAAYFELGDDDMSIKYYKKYIKKCIMPSLNIFGTQRQKIEQATYTNEQENMLSLLPKLFHRLVKKIREQDNLEKSDTLDVADSFFQCALVHDRSSSHMESIVAYIAALDLYISKSINIDNKSIDDITKTLNCFVECRFKPKDFVEVCKQYFSRDDVVQMRLKIAAMYRNNKMDDIEDIDDDDDTAGSEPREIALQYYKKIVRDDQGCTEMARCVCYYNILRLYKDFIYEDDDGKAIVDDMINWLPKFTISDRRLLVALAFEFLKEYDTNKGSCDMKINRQLQKIAKSCFDEKSKADDELCIGHSLIELDDLVFAEDYWNALTKQLECDITSRVLSLVHDPQSKLEQILHAIKPSESDKMTLLDQLTNAYQTIGDYYMSSKSNGQITDIECFRQAEIMYRTAVNLLKRLKAEPNTIKNIEEKQQKAASEANKLSQSSNK